MSGVMELQGEVCIGSLDAIPPGEGRKFVLAGQAIAVFRQRDGALYATEDTCPHRGGPLSEGVAGAGHVICPYHSYKFNLATGACLTDAACSLKTFPVREEEGWILLRF